MQITSNQAEAIIGNVGKKADELGISVIVAVLDAGGHLKAFHRMDGAVLGSIDITIRKARTSVLFQCNSEDVWEYCKPGAPAPHLELTNDGLAPYGGGIALKSPDGTMIGALGVSGGSIDQDMEIARSGHAAFVAVSRR